MHFYINKLDILHECSLLCLCFLSYFCCEAEMHAEKTFYYMKPCNTCENNSIWFTHSVIFLQVSSKIPHRQGFRPHQVLASAQPSGTVLLIAARILHPVTSSFQNIFSTNVIETNFYFIQMFLQQQLKFFFHEWSPLRKLSILCIYILTLLPVLVLL